MLYAKRQQKMSKNHIITTFQYVASNMMLENGESFASHLIGNAMQSRTALFINRMNVCARPRSSTAGNLRRNRRSWSGPILNKPSR